MTLLRSSKCLTRGWLLKCGLAVSTVFFSAAAATATVDTASRIRGAFYGAVVADALTLGTHYEYDATKIKSFYGKIDRFYAPGEKTGGETHGIGWGARNYHGGNGRGPPKAAGENTDYGDYSILILEHLAATHDSDNTQHPIQLEQLIPRWQASLKTWRSWICTQTKKTYQQVQNGVPLAKIGGNSNAMAIRHAAAYAYFDNEDAIVQAARTAMFTHRETTALDGGEFFARVTFRIIHSSMSPVEAIQQVAAEPSSSTFIRTKVNQALQKVDEVLDEATPLSQEEFADDLAITSMARLWDVGKTEPIKVGKASPTEGTLPGSVYFIVKYWKLQQAQKVSNAFAAAATANAGVGGDCASRAIAIGMVLGAAQGLDAAIPSNWGRGHYVEWDRTRELLDRAPLLQQQPNDEL